MNNSTIRICTLASCGGLLTLTAWNHYKPQAPEVDSSASADQGASQVKPNAKVARVSSGSATTPELRFPLRLGKQVNFISSQNTSSTDALVKARLKQLRQERETMMQSRSVVVPNPPTKIQSLTIARLPQSLNRVDRAVVTPVVPAVSALHGRTAVTRTAAGPAPAALKPAPATPQPLSSDLPLAAASVPAVIPTVLPPQVPASQHQSYSLGQGTASPLTPLARPSNGSDSFHTQELNSQAAAGSKLLSQVRNPGENMTTLTGAEVSTQGVKNQVLPLSTGGTGPELSGQTPGFSPLTGAPLSNTP
ncbi:MAG: hypothetical protein ACKO5P_01125 [Nodosilinea sp.]